MKKPLFLLLALSLTSCLLPPPPGAPRPPFYPGHRPPPLGHPPASLDSPQDLVGLTEAAAAHRAGLMGFSYRVVRRDRVSYPVTMDYSESRLNFTVMRGRVVGVTRG